MAGTADNAKPRLNWPQVRTLYARELRAALRERTISINSILIPIFLYPFMLWALFTAMMFVMGQTEGDQAAGDAEGLAARVIPGSESAAVGTAFDFVRCTGTSPRRRSQQVRTGSLDAFLEFLPATGPAAAFPSNFEARITWNRTRDASGPARSSWRT